MLLAALAGALAASGARAQDAPQAESPFRALLKGAGIVTDVDAPPDFVVRSRPAEEAAPIQVFAAPDEPPGKAKTAKQLEDLGSDLEAIVKRHDALRAAYPPSAKAVAVAAAAKKDKSKTKPAGGDPLPKF